MFGRATAMVVLLLNFPTLTISCAASADPINGGYDRQKMVRSLAKRQKRFVEAVKKAEELIRIAESRGGDSAAADQLKVVMAEATLCINESDRVIKTSKEGGGESLDTWRKAVQNSEVDVKRFEKLVDHCNLKEKIITGETLTKGELLASLEELKCSNGPNSKKASLSADTGLLTPKSRYKISKMKENNHKLDELNLTPDYSNLWRTHNSKGDSMIYVSKEEYDRVWNDHIKGVLPLQALILVENAREMGRCHYSPYEVVPHISGLKVEQGVLMEGIKAANEILLKWRNRNIWPKERLGPRESGQI